MNDNIKSKCDSPENNEISNVKTMKSQTLMIMVDIKTYPAAADFQVFGGLICENSSST